MPNKNITKFAAFVILASLCLILSACARSSPQSSSNTVGQTESARFNPPIITGELRSEDINESSGLAASKCHAGIYWTHNDSGDDAFLFAINEKGESLGTWTVTGATSKDWEDIAARKESDGRCYLYIGEIGNNELKREEMAVFKIVEPLVSEASANSSKTSPLETEAAVAIRFSYPDGPHNAETLLVHPQSGDIYILTKSRKEPARVFKIRPNAANERRAAELVTEITVPAIPNGLLTGGDISADGRRVVLCDYFAAYELEIPSKASGFDAIWKQKPRRFDLGDREVGEAVAYSPDGSYVLATSEKKRSPIIRADRAK